MSSFWTLKWLTPGKRRLTLWLVLFAAVYCIGIKADVMDVDAAQYAEISREMLSSGKYLEVHDLGKDYLDKPPFTFWICSQSMRLFGVNNFAYKLPSILFALLAIWSVFEFARIFYPLETAELASLILASCQGLFLMTNDCRTDTILMGAVMFAIWQFARWDQGQKLIHLILAGVGIGIGMLTKGPIALIVPVLAFGSHFLVKKQFNRIFRAQYLLVLVIIALILLPMAIGLYHQFDQHPRKIINGQTGVSGLTFYFWTQSFGRITGQSSWNNHPGFFFLIQNMLWTFFPWTFFFLSGLLISLAQWIKRRFRQDSSLEFISTGGFVLTYVSLSLSHYQLPHYIFVVFPLAAVITARTIAGIKTEYRFRRLWQFLSGIQYLLLTLALAGCALILIFTFYPKDLLPWIYIVLAALLFIFLLSVKSVKNRLVSVSIYGMVGLNIFLGGYFYPRLLHSQMGSVTGKWVHQHHISDSRFLVYRISNQSRSLSFYSQRIVPSIQQVDSVREGDYILTDTRGLGELRHGPYPLQIMLRGRNFPVTLLNREFLDKRTRRRVTAPYFLVRIGNPDG
ncbi:MAG TPA: glycosyltransferase family 39 protein [Chitinophagaceae bacterium]|nr:glycosyltransferase family 39 protein [Chitinophagaceae bacterium]